MKKHFCAAFPALPAFLVLSCSYPSASAQTADENATEQADSAAGSGHTSGIAAIAIPSAMVLYGVASLESSGIREYDRDMRGEILEDHQTVHTSADDYLQFAPAAAAYMLKFTGVESRNSLLDMTVMYGLSNVAGSAIVWSTKSLTKRERPDGSSDNSFPSGHTLTAFIAAEFLNQEYGSKSVWVGVGGYGLATMVGVARVYGNHHWVSDVIAGAGLGMLCTKGVYWLYPKLKAEWFSTHTHGKVEIEPVLEYTGGGACIGLNCRF